MTDDKEKYNATLQMFFTINTVSVFLIHVFQGHVSGAMLPLVGAALAGTAVGTAVGMFLFRRLTMTGIKKWYIFYDVCRKLSPFILNLFAETIGRLHIV